MPLLKTIYDGIKKRMYHFQQSIKKQLETLSSDEDQYDDISYVKKFFEEKNKSIEHKEYFSDQQLIVSLLDFFTGGSGTGKNIKLMKSLRLTVNVAYSR